MGRNAAWQFKERSQPLFFTRKAFIERLESNFICRALLSQKSLSKEELEELKQMINEME